ncbi:hypothetical protein C7999DRAFT_43510 [Corynascus novoguineensis]|uniref:Zn(2)-C6 fungal-type domain-containing protein n=1 Tax=Corynascus novoguineensis TaxID=1126955 RepID=A0AAN7HK13_9PEZI|nr:hypothetical protein C7999DRAFT_43510 [Corynascus novoguineensis]
MAQPPEAAPSRLQSSLDSASAQPRVQPNLDALVEQKSPLGQLQHPHQHQLQLQSQHLREHDQLQSRQHQYQHHQPQPPLLGAQTTKLPQSGDTPTTNNSSSVAQTASTQGTRNNTGTGDEKTGVEKLLPVVDGNSNSISSVAHPAELAPAVQGAPSDTQNKGGVPGPTLTSSDMSNTQPGPGPARQPVTYASPPAYPPTGMPPVSQYMYSTQSIASDPYRPSPTTLPSMRTLDHRQPQAQPHHGIPLAGHMATPTMPAPAPAHMGYYSVHPHMYGLPDPNAMRFAIPPGMAHDPRIALSGGRHKKEIKRRTKTGCLTCRKRRIKCDEAHPTCNNCKKSKRECLGYDPIFKQQHGPAAIQPAPSTQPPAAAPSTTAPAPPVPSSTPHPYQPSYPPPLPSSIVPDPAVSAAPQNIKTEPSYDYSTAIDPALQGADTAGSVGTRAPRSQQSNVAANAGHAIGDSNDLRAKKMKVDELVALGGAPPRPPNAPASPEMLSEITSLYYEVYSPGLTMFFETRWYDFKNRATTANPTAIIHNNPALVSLFASFIQSISKVKSTDPADLAPSDVLESSVVWSLARLPLSMSLAQRPQCSDSAPAEDDPWEACGRLQVFETLLTGETLTANPLSPPPPSGNIHPLRRNELEFWYQLAKYILRDHSSGSPADFSTREHCLAAMRDLLDGRENRDVLYSIAVLREYTAHWDAFSIEQNVPSHLEESDPRSKLAVATRFIRDESSTAGGTTNVVRRFAEVAYRAFVRPAPNVDRSRGRG